MFKTIFKPLAAISVCAIVAACGGGVPASNQMNINSDGDGRFSGIAGLEFTEQEIRNNASAMICGDGPIVEFRTSVLPSGPGHLTFSGRCASGQASVAGQGQVVTPAIVPATPGPTARPTKTAGTWDGSTPFVD